MRSGLFPSSTPLAFLAAAVLVVPALVGAERNDWYRDARVWVHCDNHSGLLGQGLTAEALTALFGSIPCDLIQVSAQSNGYATYLSTVGTANPQGGGYDTLATFKDVTGRLGRRLGVYMSVDRRPMEIKDHPEWAAREADGTVSISGEPIVCQKPNRQQRGYLYERFLPQIREIIGSYDPDAFWFDGDYILPRPCWCERCLAEWQADTGLAAPRGKDAPEWARWTAWHQERYRAYRRLVAEAIHQASPKALYTSNWSWAWTPEPVPAFADTLSGDAWSVPQVHAVVQRWGGQVQTPWDVMSFVTPAARAFNRYSLQRTLQEGGLTLAHGGRWCLWAFGGGDLPPAGFDVARLAAEFAQQRQSLTGPSVSLAQVAVLDSETALAAGYAAGMNSAAQQVARTLAQAGFCTDLVNEVTWRQHAAPYEVVVVAGYAAVAPETLLDLRRFAEGGGTVLVLGNALRSGEAAESVEVAALLGLARRGGRAPKASSVVLNSHRHGLERPWLADLREAKAVALAGDGNALLTARPLGQGQVACLLADGITYPEVTVFTDVLAALGKGPSYRLQNPGDAAVLATLRRLDRDTVLHLVDLTARVADQTVDVDTPDETQWNPLRSTTVLLACETAPRLVEVVPMGVRAEGRWENGQLSLRVWPWQTHVAIRLADTGRLALPPPAAPATATTEAAFHPERSRGGIIFAEDFERLAAGAIPVSPWQAAVAHGTTLTAVPDPAGAIGRCLRFQDREASSFWPFLHRSVPAFGRGSARLSFDLRLEAEAECLVEVRYENVAPGPSLAFRGGQVLASGQVVMPAGLPNEQWVHVDVALRLGTEDAGYDVTVTAPGLPGAVRRGIAFADEDFTLCNSVYVVGTGQKAAGFCLDNIRFERQAETP